MSARRGPMAEAWIWQGAGLVAAVAAAAIGYAAAGWSAAAFVAAGAPVPAATAVRAAASAGPAIAAPADTAAVAPSPWADPAGAGPRGAAAVDIERLWESSALAGAGAAGAAGTGPEAWTIAGIYQTETGPAVIVTFAGSTPQRYLRVSEKLPNGATIVAIEPDRITVRTLINQRWVLVAIDV